MEKINDNNPLRPMATGTLEDNLISLVKRILVYPKSRDKLMQSLIDYVKRQIANNEQSIRADERGKVFTKDELVLQINHWEEYLDHFIDETKETQMVIVGILEKLYRLSTQSGGKVR